MGMSLSQLYCVAYRRRFPHAAARVVIHDLAEAMFGLPTARLTERMMQTIAECLEGMEYDARRDPRPAIPSSPGASPCAEQQRDQIRQQACALGWTTSVLNRFLAHGFNVRALHQLTVDQAAECLARMKGMKDTASDRRRAYALTGKS